MNISGLKTGIFFDLQMTLLNVNATKKCNADNGNNLLGKAVNWAVEQLLHSRLHLAPEKSFLDQLFVLKNLIR